MKRANGIPREFGFNGKETYFFTESFMKKIVLIISLFTFCATISFSAFELKGNFPRSIIFGSSFVAMENDVWSTRFNPAGIASLSSFQSSVSYSPQLFGIKEISSSAFSFVYPLNDIGVLGGSVHSFGFEMYREISPTISFAKQFDDFSFGVNLNYNMLTIERYGNEVALGIDIGALANISENISIGFSTTNINSPTISQKKEKLPQTFLLGVSYKPIESTLLAVGVEKDVRYNPSPSVGLEIFPIDELALRVGIQDEPTLFNAGFGVHVSNFVFDYAASSHQILGLTHYISISFQ